MDNLIVLGEAVPDELKDSRKVICTACYSEEHGLVRIYPIPPNARMRRWDRVSIPLERNPQDTRVESWKVLGSRREWHRLGEKIHRQGKLDRADQIKLLHKMYDDFGADCIQDLNDDKRSLGIVKPKILKAWMAERGKDYDPTVQITLDSDIPFHTIRNYQLQPRVQYRCTNCRVQSIQVPPARMGGGINYLDSGRDLGPNHRICRLQNAFWARFLQSPTKTGPIGG